MCNFLKWNIYSPDVLDYPWGFVVPGREGALRARMNIAFNVKFNEQKPLTFKLQSKAH